MLLCGAKILSANGNTIARCCRTKSHVGDHHFEMKNGAYRFYRSPEMRKRRV